MPRKLTARNVATLPAPSPDSMSRQIDYWDTVEEGLALRVSTTHRAWIVRYRVDGRRRRLTLGDLHDLTLAEARKNASDAKRAAANGIDPAAAQEARREAGTFEDLVAEYLKAAKVAGKKSWKGDERTINAELLSRHRANWRYVKVRELTRTMIRSVFKAITDRGAPVMANRTLALVSTMLNYALVELEWIEANPAARIRKNKETPRPRVLSDQEIRELWAATNETVRTNEQGQRFARLNATLNDAFKMRFYTAQRGCEVFLMRWEDVDLETAWWEIPGMFTKNGEVHRVPLVVAAVELLKGRQSSAREGAVWVFENLRPSRKRKRDAKNDAAHPRKRDFGNVAARGRKAAAFLSRGDAHLDNRRARTRKRGRYLPGLTFEFRGHDIRRTASTNMTKAGVPRDDVSKILNHVDRGARATRVYDRYEYDREKRTGLETWARRLREILEPKPRRQDEHPVPAHQVDGHHAANRDAIAAQTMSRLPLQRLSW
jgi:integrase